MDYSAMGSRGLMKNQGWPDHVFDGRPVVGICNTWPELSPCNAHLRDLAEAVKRGVWEAGGFPLEFPVGSVGETLAKPCAMLFRNLISMDVEEAIRANPMDGVVLLGGCDKTVPSLLMGAASVDLPTLFVSSAPTARRPHRGQHVCAGDQSAGRTLPAPGCRPPARPAAAPARGRPPRAAVGIGVQGRRWRGAA